MSLVSSNQPEFDFWEFANCSKCQLSFLSGPNSTVATTPFWLTECGHVVCNNHLNSDQSCAQCGAQDIQLLPLQREMDPPMSEWFQSVPHMLDAAAYAAKFQQESMASQIRTLKARHHQQRLYIEKLKREISELRRTNEMLQQQAGMMEYTEEPVPFVNANGKRPMRSPATSSPRPISTPLGMNRLTLPPGQKPPLLSSKPTEGSSDPESLQRRPGSSHFVQEYAYVPSPNRPSVPHPPASSRRSKPFQNPTIQKRSPEMMPPPAVPPTHLLQRSSKQANSSVNSLRPPVTGRPHQPPPFASNASRAPPTSVTSSNRFMDQIATSSRAPSRANTNAYGGGQRIPFVPR